MDNRASAFLRRSALNRETPLEYRHAAMLEGMLNRNNRERNPDRRGERKRSR